MRFEVTRALDAVETRLRTDPLIAGAIVDLSEAIRLPGLGSNRKSNLLSLGLVVDALSRHLSDESVALYGIAERGLLSEAELTSNERMVLRRWSDDGMIEIIPAGQNPGGRVTEVAFATGLPLITARGLPAYTGARFMPVAGAGGINLIPGGTALKPQRGGPLSRLWRCQSPGCPSFPRGHSQVPPMLAGGVPMCPRHRERLTDIGPKPAAVAMVLRTNGLAKYRFALVEGAPLTIGRSPDGPGAVAVARYLQEQPARRISRSHLRLELVDSTIVATDLSTNGSVLRTRTDPSQPATVERLNRGAPFRLGELDSVELAEGVEIARADLLTGRASGAQPSSVMQDAPTMAIRMPPVR